MPFDTLGELFVDGSVTAEVPKDQLRSLFQVNQFLISQVPAPPTEPGVVERSPVDVA